MRAGNWTEREDDRNERATGRDRVREQGDGDVAAREPLSHDARANDRGEQ